MLVDLYGNINKMSDLEKRIKENYENRTRFSLPLRTYTIIRLDGKAFHSYTKNLKRPFDEDLMNDMDNSVISFISEIQGAKFAYIQSDEVSILLTDFMAPATDAWFDGNVQKIASVSSSMMTAHFNQLRRDRQVKHALENYLDFSVSDRWPLAYFDSRVFTIPDPTEVYNYFVFRWKDCERNSISAVAQSQFSHKELEGKGSDEKQAMLLTKDINWSKFKEEEKNGRFIVKEKYFIPGEVIQNAFGGHDGSPVERSRWVMKPAWKLTKDPFLLRSMIPSYT